MTASISHEIRNVLAIINEDSGLLEDLTFRADKGIPLDTERLRSLAGKMKAQIKRGDRIIENMNRFAHSVDEALTHVDLKVLLALVHGLAERSASMRLITLESKFDSKALIIETCPFFLQNLLWRCLDFSMDLCGGGKTITLTAEETDHGVLIRYLWEQEGTADQPRPFPARIEKAMLEMLNARVRADIPNGEIVLILSKDPVKC
jgi:signal transduction histidine kinase